MSDRFLRVRTRHTRSMQDGLYVRWTGPPATYEGYLANASAQGMTLQTLEDANHTVRIPAEQVLSVEDLTR